MDSLGLSSAQSLQALSALLSPQEEPSDEQQNVRSEWMCLTSSLLDWALSSPSPLG